MFTKGFNIQQTLNGCLFCFRHISKRNHFNTKQAKKVLAFMDSHSKLGVGGGRL